MKEKYVYYYLHTNGDLIYKPAQVVNMDSSYFDSPYVKKVWQVPLNFGEVSKFLTDAKRQGAKSDRILDAAKFLKDKIDKENPVNLKEQKLRNLIRKVIKEEINDIDDTKKMISAAIKFDSRTALIYFHGIPFTIEDIEEIHQAMSKLSNTKPTMNKQFKVMPALAIKDTASGESYIFTAAEITVLDEYVDKLGRDKIASRREFTPFN